MNKQLAGSVNCEYRGQVTQRQFWRVTPVCSSPMFRDSRRMSEFSMTDSSADLTVTDRPPEAPADGADTLFAALAQGTMAGAVAAAAMAW
jgi:hypothetical protein